MDFLYQIGVFFAGTTAGIVIGSFVLGNAILSISYGLQLSIRLKNLGLIADNRPLFRYLATFAINCILILLAFCAFFLFFPDYLIGFLFGLGITSLQLGRENVRYNNDNLLDYVEYNAQSFTRDLREFSENEINHYFDLRQTGDIQGNQLFARVCGELISNTLFYGVFTLGVLIIGSLSWWIGIFLAGFLAVVTFFSGLQTLVLVLTVPVLVLATVFSKNPGYRDIHDRVMWKENFWMTVAIVPRSIELGISLLYLGTMYWFFFPFR